MSEAYTHLHRMINDDLMTYKTSDKRLQTQQCHFTHLFVRKVALII